MSSHSEKYSEEHRERHGEKQVALERPPGLPDYLTGSALLASSLALLAVYAKGQLGHTLRFLFELFLDFGRLFG